MRTSTIVALAGSLIISQWALADPKPEAINFRWTQTVVGDTAVPLGITRTKSANIERKQEKRVAEFVDDFQEKLSNMAPATFYVNPPFQGELNFTVNVKPSFKWGAVPHLSISEDNRAAGVAEAVAGRSKLPGDAKLSDIPKPSDTGKAKAVDYDIIATSVEFRDLKDSLIARVVLKAEDGLSVKPKELAELVATEIRRYLAAQSAHIEVPDSM